MHGTRRIMQAGRLREGDVSVTVARTVDHDSGPVADLWFSTADDPSIKRISLQAGDWCMLGTRHRMAAREVLASTRERPGAVTLEIEEINDAHD